MDILVECVGGRIALTRELFQRLEDDRVEVAFQDLRELAPGRPPSQRNGLAQRRATGRLWIRLQNRLFERSSRITLEPVWSLSRQQLVEHHAEGIDIRGGGDGRAGDLFGSRVVRCQSATADQRELRFLCPALRQELGDSEVEQQGVTFLGHEDVGGLQIAMDHEVGMCVLDGIQHLPEEIEPRRNRQTAIIAERRQRRTGDILQRQVGLSVFGYAGIEQACDVGMTQAREDLAFASESLRHDPIHQGRVHEFQSDTTRKQSIRTLGEPDTSHPAPSDERQDPVGAELLADHSGDGFGDRSQLTRELSAVLEEAGLLRSGLRGEQVTKDQSRRGISGFETSQPLLTLDGRELEGLIQQPRYPQILGSCQVFEHESAASICL